VALDLGFDEDAVHVEEKLDDAIAYAVERADATEDFAGGVLITGSITVVGEARTLLGKDAS
jgi:dihydrofolate synthase/folylpolyglutamate synthase